MPAIRSIVDLKRVREEALERHRIRTSTSIAHIAVGMGTCGIAAGARETLKAILEQVETEKHSGIIVTQTGCIGLCEHEPIVQVLSFQGSKTTYAKVTPEVAERIIREHVLAGKVVTEFLVR